MSDVEKKKTASELFDALKEVRAGLPPANVNVTEWTLEQYVAFNAFNLLNQALHQCVQADVKAQYDL